MRARIIPTLGLALVMFGCSLVEKLANRPPMILRVFAMDYDLSPGDTTTVMVEAEDPDGDRLSFQWNSTGGSFVGPAGEARTVWQSPTQPGSYRLTATVKDENGAQASDGVTIVVASEEPPQVTILRPAEGQALPGLGSYRVEARVTHPTSPIERVEFFVNGVLHFTDTAADGDLYVFLWSLDGLSGPKTLVVKGYRLSHPGPPGVDSVHVVVEGVTPFPK
ncbi:MAG: Ig-like domain-containing protein [candidate division KSB1 bacterium]|nr:Ig-like domain-containing protein [candidate division KSB1 bacterium]